VYALPFTSVIDQVVDELEEIYETGTTGRLLTAHHHLAETTIRDGTGDAEKADLSDDTASMLAESWRGGLTVTTFVQLFESLAGPRNRQSMKLPALYNSVIILDEPQSLPLDWWKLAPRLIGLLTEQYGATVIAMTATQPRLFEGTNHVDDVVELVDEPETYFDCVTRVAYELDGSAERYLADRERPKSYASAAAELRTAFDTDTSALAVCNTIDSACELTARVTASEPAAVNVGTEYADALADAGDVGTVDPVVVANSVETAGDRAVLHLSTRLRPADRLTLIETAKELTERGHGLVVVSTQLVEAGVDISFDRVYRDLAPIDSIVQAAGRCNRSFERDRGCVTVWWLEVPGDQAKTPAEAVYNRGVSLLPVAAETLRSVRDDVESLTETTVARTSVEQYYRRLREERNVGDQTYADYVDNARADDLGDLSLIDQRRSVEVLVCRTAKERSLADAIRKADREYDFGRLQSLLDETKPLRISIPIYRHDDETAEAIEALPRLVEEEGIYELDVRHHGTHFDPTEGFVVPDSTVEARLL
jgi:CRISPR-associated endonuclease/helicase Cas3/CRISPR-associated endonuclease Cas3-HD